MKIKIEHNNKLYQINSRDGISISIPMNFNDDNNPKFYDETNPKKEFYTYNDIEYNVNNNAGCNVPLVKFNVHCSGTHTETASHVFSDADSIGNLLDLNFLPAVLISLNPESNLDDKYHSTITLDDRIISKEMLKESLASETEFIDCIIIRTLPNSEDKKNKNYNNSSHPFLSNDAVYFLKDKGVKHIIIDTPSIDKSDDGGQLKNHKIFFLDDDKTINKNTVTELAYIPDTCIDGRYFVCIGFPNFQLDAAPSNPVIYRVQ
jgi:kynurenine formamidase